MRWTAEIFCWNEREVSDVLCKNILVAELLGTQYLFEILQPSLTVKNSENVVKSGWFEICSRWRAAIFFKMKDGYKISCIKIFIFC